MINIEKAFVTENRSVFDFFQQPGLGFYIPLYQREYSWDSDNIAQLLEDISKGITRLVEEKDENEIRFLGTIITVVESDKNNIQPQDTQALPSRIDKLIDGQQRLSTIAVFATLLYKHIDLTLKKLGEKEPLKNDIIETCDNWKEKLLEIYSLDLRRGTPRHKPKIIRGQDDRWTRDGAIVGNYKSPIAKYLGTFIEEVVQKKEISKPDKVALGQNLVQNIRSIDNWLANKVRLAHVNESEDFETAWNILDNMHQENIWSFERQSLKEQVDLKEKIERKSVSYILCELVQLFSVCHYLTERCCFTIIQPSNDDWAFDMFQSLNATGTPLTALETFKPNVVQTTEKVEQFKSSLNEKSFSKVEDLFLNVNTAAQKSKLTNDFLTSFAISFNGAKLSSHFSHQKKWLDEKLKDLEKGLDLTDPDVSNKLYNDKRDFIKYFGDYAEFYKKIWLDYEGQNAQVISAIASSPEADLASLLLLFLKESNHKMAITFLAKFYKDVIDGKDASVEHFVSAIKAIGAFYAIWRSAQTNSGLDNVYRTFFKKGNIQYKSVDVTELKSYLRNTLSELGIFNEGLWIEKSFIDLKYNKATSVCKLALFVAAHDTMPDDLSPGLMKPAAKGSSNYLNLLKWTNSDLKTIEHIAPRNGEANWDERLYDFEKELFQSIGNLTLLPTEINSSLSNKGWKAKYIYYKHLSEKDPVKLQELSNRALALGVTLNSNTITLLQDANYHDHISHLVTLTEHGQWDSDLVEKRAKRILKIFWDRISLWLN
ncbi:hypothetical protein BWI97_13855 [Siphonobacter sp. BAB-5405]|uniref:DUF262 domain-containing protein n=1 Tax=Siphonobacter sp. BAB-5405 TaxID=1864825 RepID=UPI000C7F91F8|nr:DUF262 domain-containing HNH endonuclease family protein [Siphonobacter sp. BAB-5405]PMD95682.1 hypothetical protein BWI97_13855 [Siphonobacter sp. BAB-5405]